MKVSIVIPVYNVELYLRQCLESVLAQTFSDFEAICVNDGSTDDSLAILKEFAAKDPRFRIIEQPNGGLSAARNTGAEKAQGKYLYFLDSDDWIEPDLLQRCYETAELYDTDEVIFGFVPEYEEGAEKQNLAQKALFPPGEIKSGKEYFTAMELAGYYHQCAWIRFMKRNFYKQNSFSYMPGVLYEDAILHITADLLAERVVYLDIELYHYRIRNKSIMRSSFTFRNIYSYWCCERNVNLLLEKYSEIHDLCQALFLYRAEILRSTAKGIAQVPKNELEEGIRKYPEIKSFLFSVNTIKADLHYFDMMIRDYGWNETEILREKMDFILHRSISYKVGKVIMWLPQKIMQLLKGLFKHG